MRMLRATFSKDTKKSEGKKYLTRNSSLPLITSSKGSLSNQDYVLTSSVQSLVSIKLGCRKAKRQEEDGKKIAHAESHAPQAYKSGIVS